ncbi:Chromosomal replication initiator protein DnaA 1 [Chlamydia muridarum str. Nigg]|uniref:Chromosomal replication initiator protein DnaA 1 n=2 Tax=Chlamydia muridarum TaxID=83560 RepID=DNAA1_CHLMU|nr:chromosomal replication initiator protein DnaA [Chlamydia muridarum]Q9PKE4.1 RecName: Full=Chromosomal replication initiator protein DnaA 1 [Chlamydia muridarum str. Nigg]UFW37663.1 Chromosomal replication initiator protein DnaA 1 [Chlamydia trachomatis]AAF39363.1 chromosomal replication initiator protein DnaA [Chlamydia muridarum str. Nigg]AHH22910.1 chromosomal replication initiation protein [Chlamydia muridarum str. Nigg3 CMUT3-5]AHH23835.1 chromosomal replication initiation protein [Chl
MRAWEEFLLLQEKEIGTDTVNKWLRSLKVLCFDACNLYLEAKDSFQVTWFEEHIRHKVKANLINNNGKPIRVRVTSLDKSTPFKESQIQQEKTAYFTMQYGDIDPQMSFANFLVTPENDLPVRILQEFAKVSEQGKGFPFNPIYLFGPESSGKTHLMQAAVGILREAGVKTLYVSSQLFTEHLVSAIRSGEMQRFRAFYRNVEALFIEDIEVLSGKGATQEEFFHTFNSLHTEGKLIVISSIFAPGDLKAMEERLISRFEWGIAVPVSPLTREGLKSFLERRIEQLNIRIEETALDFLIQALSSHIKSLLHALTTLAKRVAYKKLSHQLLYQGDVEALLQDVLQAAEHIRLTPSGIVRATAQYYGVSPENILGRSQSREYVLPRQVAMFLCRQKLSLSYVKIGEVFSRDHSTVISSIRAISQKLDEDDRESDVSCGVQELTKRLSSAYQSLDLIVD